MVDWFVPKLVECVTVRKETTDEYITRIVSCITKSRIGDYYDSPIDCTEKHCVGCKYFSHEYDACLINKLDEMARDILSRV